MAIAKKGFRKIEVGEKYAWKFNGKVFVAKERNNRSTLIIDFGWFDEWLFANDRENRPPDFYPRMATPKFVSESIQFAIKERKLNKVLLFLSLLFGLFFVKNLAIAVL